MSKISQLVALAKIETTSISQTVNFGNFPNFQAQEIARITGVQIRGSLKTLTAFDVTHALKEHGDHQEQQLRGQIGVVDADFDLIPEILKSPDSVIKGDTIRGHQSLVFTKRIKCLYHIVMRLEGKGELLKVVFKTMYKKP